MREALRRLAPWALVVGIVASCRVAAGAVHLRPVVVAVATIVAALGAVRVGVAVGRQRRLARLLRRQAVPGQLAGVEVALVPVRGLAAVAGLRRPTVFCDRGLDRLLTADEQRAVVLHERCHQVRRDPVRLSLLAAAAPLVRRSTAAAGWHARAVARIEIRADRYALLHGAEPRAIAAALVKLARPSVPLGAGAAGFASAIDLRLRALTGQPEAPRPPRARVLLVLALVVLVVAACALGGEGWSALDHHPAAA